MVREAAGAFRLMGNVSTADLMMGQPADIEAQVFANLEAGVDIISPGCAISPRCPNVNLRAMVDAVIEWHRAHP
jgi:[methyl-Co(III) methanol-specific corrinoid protein]:coenzyme M methyltransferase